MLADINKMENYEKRYKSLVEAVKTLKEANPSDEGIQNWVKDNVPELKEKEDERIRKEIINYIKYSNVLVEQSVFISWIAWLEKQKPAEWSEMDLLILDSIISVVEEWEDNRSEKEKEYYGKSTKSDWLKSLKDRIQPQPKQEWGEEDEKMLNSFLHKVEVCGLLTNKEKAWIVKKLKSLRPQQWKSSDEQIIALRWVLNNVPYCKHKEEIRGLLDQLKKLKEDNYDRIQNSIWNGRT